jgi:hypothetical protein
MLTRMRAQQFMIGRRDRLAPSPLRMPVLDQWRSPSNAVWPFWMAWARIFQAPWIVKNRHQGCNVAIQRIFDYSQLDCHVEPSEASLDLSMQLVQENPRFFASLRMTR